MEEIHVGNLDCECGAGIGFYLRENTTDEAENYPYKLAAWHKGKRYEDWSYRHIADEQESIAATAHGLMLSFEFTFKTHESFCKVVDMERAVEVLRVLRYETK